MVTKLMIMSVLMTIIRAVSSATPYTFKHSILDESWLGGETQGGHTQFDAQTNNDFSQGFSQDLDMMNAKLGELVTTQDKKAYIGVNYKDVLPTDSTVGRQSVHLWNHTPLTEGLYILDIEHAPVANCTLYSLLRLIAIDPVHGQLESVYIPPNYMDWIGYTGSDKCTPSKTTLPPDLPDLSTTTFGDAINNQKGVTWAVEWRADQINVWSWFPNHVPNGLLNATALDPTAWGPPPFQMSGDCHIDRKQKQWISIRIHTSFCPTWDREVYFKTDCFATWPICTHYVAHNPSAYAEAYWLIKSIKVYDQPGQDSEVST